MITDQFRKSKMDEYTKALEKENLYLKSLLDQAGISYDITQVNQEVLVEQDVNQGARILPKTIKKQDANLFFSMFWGRTDVYSKQGVKKSTGEASYYPQCANFWKSGCPRIRSSKIKCRDCEMQAYKELKEEQIIAHLRGDAPDATDVIGIYSLLPDGTCRFLVFDFDNHERNAAKNDFANRDDTWKEEVDVLREICVINGIDALTERSRSGKGAHV